MPDSLKEFYPFMVEYCNSRILDVYKNSTELELLRGDQDILVQKINIIKQSIFTPSPMLSPALSSVIQHAILEIKKIIRDELNDKIEMIHNIKMKNIISVALKDVSKQIECEVKDINYSVHIGMLKLKEAVIINGLVLYAMNEYKKLTMKGKIYGR